jgi:hypothetical protein
MFSPFPVRNWTASTTLSKCIPMKASEAFYISGYASFR